jgi:hypothetical protein
MAAGWWLVARGSASAPSVEASSLGSAGACSCQQMHAPAMEVSLHTDRSQQRCVSSTSGQHVSQQSVTNMLLRTCTYEHGTTLFAQLHYRFQLHAVGDSDPHLMQAALTTQQVSSTAPCQTHLCPLLTPAVQCLDWCAGPLLQPRGQTSVFYTVPPPASADASQPATPAPQSTNLRDDRPEQTTAATAAGEAHRSASLKLACCMAA